MCLWYHYTHKPRWIGDKQENETRKKVRVEVLAVEAPRFRKGSGAKEDSSPASSLSIL
jgi:hypothetical protein